MLEVKLQTQYNS